MKKFLSNNYVLTLILAFVLLITLIVASHLVYEARYDFVRGRYGTHCYPIERYHSNIEYLIKFETLEECLKSLHE